MEFVLLFQCFPFEKVSKWAGSGLQAGNVGIHENRLSMWLDHSKTDQLGCSTLIKFWGPSFVPAISDSVGWGFPADVPKLSGFFLVLENGAPLSSF